MISYAKELLFHYPTEEEYILLTEDEKEEINEKLHEFIHNLYYSDSRSTILEKLEPKLKKFKPKNDLAVAILLIIKYTQAPIYTSAEHDTIYFGNDYTELCNISRGLFLRLLYMNMSYAEGGWQTFI